MNMMKIFIPIIVAGVFAFPHSARAQDSPCADSTFIALKRVPIDDMSERQYDYFMMMSENCASTDTLNYTVDVRRSQKLGEEARLIRAKTNFLYFYMGLLVFGLIGAAIWG